MKIAKVRISPSKDLFAEVIRVGSVLFDPRPDWILLRWHLGERPRRAEWKWMHPSEIVFEWVREFNFKEVK